MVEQGVGLSDIFGAALQSMVTRRQDVNDLDGYNGNHGDNMVANLELIMRALQARPGAPPTEALAYAGEQVEQAGRGGTSQYYARGLKQAAGHLQGHTQIDNADVMTLVQTLLGAIPAEGYPQSDIVESSVLTQVLGKAKRDLPGSTITGEIADASAEINDGLDLGEVVGMLLPIGMAFLKARQAGSEPQAAVGQALVGALLGQPEGATAATTPRAAAGSVIARSILQQVLGH